MAEQEKHPEILIVGGSGFIGRHIVNRAMQMGWNVTVLHHSETIRHNITGVNWVCADISNKLSLREALAGRTRFSYVVNCGGYINHAPFFKNGRNVLEVHFSGVMNLVEILDHACLRSFVNIGSSDEYGNIPAPQKENDPASPISPYSMGKYAATAFLKMLAQTENFPATTLRLFLVYGPGQDEKRFLPQIIRGCLNNESFPVSMGNQLRDFLFVGDMVDAVFATFSTDAARGEVFNIASGVATSVKSMIEYIRSKVDGGEPQYGKVAYRPNENMALYADVSKAKSILNWTPATSLDKGLDETISYYKSNL
jgi:UDP-glucose 4-epimerase